MMASNGTSISSSNVVRFLMVELFLLALLQTGADGGSVTGAGKLSAVSVPEDGDNGSAIGASSEMLEDESFEQDVSSVGNVKTTTSTVESEAATGKRWTAGTSTVTVTETTLGYDAVATTPKIVQTVKKLSRYEQGLEDYDEAADRAEREQQKEQTVEEQQQQQQQQQQYNNMLKPMLTLFNVISTVLSSGRSMRSTVPGKDSRTTVALDAGQPDGDHKNGNITFGGKSTSGGDNENETATAVTGGRYIKGDPLNGYYDFVISEGSYKFWVVFQLFTAGLVLYATFAAIYYSKVSPLTSDYDYIDYLNGARSFAGGRSMARTGATGHALATVEGRYIKGDPLNGYYDFVISEGSYKFWAVFQLVTAAVVIYSTLTAIYYSKVAPLTSDYDYIDYLNGGRSFAGARPSDATRSGSRGGQATGWNWDSLSTSNWFGPAAQAFTIVMDAIERHPK